jgi:hypothetical protein
LEKQNVAAQRASNNNAVPWRKVLFHILEIHSKPLNFFDAPYIPLAIPPETQG